VVSGRAWPLVMTRVMFAAAGRLLTRVSSAVVHPKMFLLLHAHLVQVTHDARRNHGCGPAAERLSIQGAQRRGARTIVDATVLSLDFRHRLVLVAAIRKPGTTPVGKIARVSAAGHGLTSAAETTNQSKRCLRGPEARQASTVFSQRFAWKAVGRRCSRRMRVQHTRHAP
jgi:hypothetical protein